MTTRQTPHKPVPSKPHRLHVDIDARLHDAMLTLAEREQRTLKIVVERALRRELKRYQM